MIQPRALDIRDFPANFKAWAIQGKSGRLLVVPDRRFPGRRPIRFFETEYDAARFLDFILDLKPKMEIHNLVTVEVHLLDALRKVVADGGNRRADSYVVLSTSEVYEFIAQLKQKAAE